MRVQVDIHKPGGRDGKPELTAGTVSLTLSAVELTEAAQLAGTRAVHAADAVTISPLR